MSVVVTGAGGYVGAALVDALVRNGDTPVLALTRPGGNTLPTPHPPGVEQAAVDLTDRQALASAFAKFRAETIVHAAAAIFGNDDPGTLAKGRRDNVEGTAALVAAAADAGVTGIVLLSSISVYGPVPLDADAGFRETDPVDPNGGYGCQKAEAEAICMDWQQAGRNRHLIILRLAGVHGGRRQAGAVYRMIQSAKAGSDIQITEPDSRFSFLHIGDGVAAIRCALAALPKIGAECLNIASGEQVTLAELAETILQICESRSRIVKGDGLGRVSALDITKARDAIGFSPRPLAGWVTEECGEVS